MIDTVFLVRHGHKKILDNPEWKKTASRPYDTPLSQKGIKQAEVTARFLEREKIDVIFSSPFYRALETACIIADRLHKKVNVEWGFCEWLNPNWFDKFPVLMSTEEASEVFPLINKEYISYTIPAYPEIDREVHVYERVKSTLMKIQEYYSGSILIVGHGASVRQAARVLTVSPQEISTDMCAVNKLVNKNNKWILEYVENPLT